MNSKKILIVLLAVLTIITLGSFYWWQASDTGTQTLPADEVAQLQEISEQPMPDLKEDITSDMKEDTTDESEKINTENSDLSVVEKSIGSVELLSKSPCESDPNETCLEIKVWCSGLKSRGATIRASQTQSSKGAILFTTGGDGGGFYGGKKLSENTPKSQTVRELHEKGFETYEISWDGNWGWGQDNPGAGLKEVMCGYTTVAEWVHDEIASKPEVMCTTGNSGGGMQIGYGLAIYGLESILDLAVISGGPPTADFIDVCTTGGGGNNEPGQGSVRSIMDYVMGWFGNGDYCHYRNPPESLYPLLDAHSIVSNNPNEVRDFSYPNTRVSFVQGDQDEPNADRGEKYYNAITTEKSWTIVPSRHGVHEDPEGALAIRGELLLGCKAQ